MLSEKTALGIKNGSAIRAMFVEGKIMAEKYGPENVYDYSLGNPATPAPEKLKEILINEIKNEDPVILHGYMNNAGFPEVRRALAENLNRRFQTDFDENDLIMTVGAAGGLNITLKAILNPGEEVIVFSPYFGEYKNYVSNYDGKLIEVSPNTENFQPDLAKLNEKFSL